MDCLFLSRQSCRLLTFFILLSCNFAFGLQPSNGRASNPSTSDHERAVASSILKSLRERTSDPPLHVATDLYDPSTGLHSEGVWHNAMLGIASLRLSQVDASRRIADSLWKYSWDGTSFRRRAYSGLWDHTTGSEGLVQANYYKESGEHRCVQHGMALVFWSLLIRQGCDEERYKQQQSLIATSFLEEFWDERVGRWNTVSQTQGGGTTTRPSASMGRVGEDREDYYYRSVDQAVAVLACLLTLRVLEGQEGHQEDCNRIRTIIQKTCHELLADSGFGYGNEDGNYARAYIGLNRKGNFWHDGWVMLALVCARTQVWRDDPQSGEGQLQALFRRLVGRYGHLSTDQQTYDGTLWHWARSMKPDEASGNVRYCGDNALLYAITRNLDTTRDETDFCGSAFWMFIEELRSRDKDGLASVADVYKQVRLHPNTELACLGLWQFDQF